MASFRDLLTQTKAKITEVTTEQGNQLIDDGAVLLDVREPEEYGQGAIPDSLHVSRGQLESNVENRIPDKATKLVVMCAGGVRSAFAAKTLAELGYTDVVSMGGGFNK
ncbi:rhodanese-like domain-containing protein, partial [Acidimicrobiaceae bacterium]|nr:rhodanese-like domain-containing protein [Acidimicrobiaceae bacterium]